MGGSALGMNREVEMIGDVLKIQGKKEIGKREILAGRRGRNVSTATELDTSLENVGSQGEKLVLEESRKKKSNPFYRNKVFNEDDGILLDKLEG